MTTLVADRYSHHRALHWQTPVEIYHKITQHSRDYAHHVKLFGAEHATWAVCDKCGLIFEQLEEAILACPTRYPAVPDRARSTTAEDRVSALDRGGTPTTDPSARGTSAN